MLVPIAVAAGVVLVLLLLTAALRRSSRSDEVERFHRARSMTTAWSRAAGGSVPVAEPAQEQAEIDR